MKKIAFAALAVLTMGPALMSSSAFAFDRTAPAPGTCYSCDGPVPHSGGDKPTSRGPAVFDTAPSMTLFQASRNAMAILESRNNALSSILSRFQAPASFGAPAGSESTAFTGSDIRADGSRPWQ